MRPPEPQRGSSATRGPQARHYCDYAFGFLSRHRKNNEKAEEASVLLRDNLELQNFLQNCQEVRLQQGAAAFLEIPF